MSEAQEEAEPQDEQDQPTDSKVLRQDKKSKKQSRHIKTLSTGGTNPKKRRNKSNAIPLIINNSEEENAISKEPCGLGCLVIDRCQRFNNIGCFMTVFCILHLSQGMVFGLVDLSIDMLQMDDRLKVMESIVLSSSYDISSFLVVVFISYYIGRGNMARWIVFASFLVGLGSLLFAFPFYGDKSYQLIAEPEDICQERKAFRTCKNSLSFRSKYVTFFILGQTVQGIAGMILYIPGVCFVDENTSAHSTGVYLGLTEASVTIGYALGYAIGAPLLRTLENSTVDNGFELHGNDEHWLQTWWIRFVFVAIIAWSTLIPLSCFPEEIKGTAKIKAGKQKKPHLLDGIYEEEESKTSIKDLCVSFQILLKTPIFVCLALTRASESLLTIGASEFLPKYVENQFILSPSMATIVSGIVLIPGAALGQLLGGIIVSQLHMACKGFMRFTIVTSTISVILLVLSNFVRCNPIPFAGISEDYSGTGKLGNMTAPCNSHCGCSTTYYSAVCGRDDIGYFSPCFAGCRSSKTIHNQKTYFNCSCINEGLTTADDQGDFIDARPGTCDAKCYKLPLFIVFMFSTMVFAGFSGIPILLTVLRIVPDKQRCLAVGVTYVFLRVFGSIPGPIAFKLVGESTCTYRDSGRCGNEGICWIYNTTKMAYFYLGICKSYLLKKCREVFLCKVNTIIFTAVAFVMYKNLQKKKNILSTPLKTPKLKKKGEKETTDL